MASFQTGLRLAVKPLGVTALSGAAGTTNAGSTIAMCEVERGSLSALVYQQATTNGLTTTPKWQVSADGSTWYDVKPSNNAANVVLSTGTGSAVANTVVVSAPDAVYGWAYGRAATLIGAQTASTGDEHNISYYYMQRGYGAV